MAESLATQRSDEGSPDWMAAAGVSDHDNRDFSWAEDESTLQSADSRPVLSDGPVPAGLGAHLAQALAQSRPSFVQLDRAIAQASVEERSAAYRSAAVQQCIASCTLTASEKLALSTALAEGSLRWEHTQGGRSNFADYFSLRDALGPPPDMRGMSCFELILYSAWMLGQLTVSQIVALYERDPGGIEWVDYAKLGFSSSLPVYVPGGTSAPSPGDIVFAVTVGNTIPRHVMMSLGGDSAMSLDKENNRETPTSRVSLTEEAQGHTLYFGPAPWVGA